MGSPKDIQKNQSSFLVKRPAISDSANIHNINSQLGPGVPLFNNFSDLGVSRIQPSRFNIGSNVTKMDLKTKDVFSVAYGNCDCKYFNTGYDLSDKYNTCNYLNSYQNKTSFWDRLFNGFGKALMIGGFVSAGIGLVGGIMSLFSKNKSEASSESDKGEEIKVHDAEDINVSDTEESQTLSELDELDISELIERRDNLQTEVDKMKEDYANIDSSISSLEQEKEALTSPKRQAKTAWDNKQKELGNMRSEFNRARDNQEKCNKAVTSIRKDLDGINEDITLKENQLQQMQNAGQDTTALSAEIRELKAKREETKRALNVAMNNLEKANEEFKQKGEQVETLEKEANSLKEQYNSYQDRISQIDEKIKSLKNDKKEYPSKIAEKETHIEIVNIKLQHKENEPA